MPDQQTVSDHIVERLIEWGVRRVFGYPGDGINGVMAALDRASDRIAFVQAPHEELAALMACGHAKFTGELGVCIVTSGPGAVHILNGLYDARADHQPVLALVGQQARMALGTDYQQEIDLVSLFKDVAHEYVQMAVVPEQVQHLVDRAARIAIDQRAVTCLVLPHDLQELPAAQPQRTHGANFSGVARSARALVPGGQDLQRAADLLNAGSRVAMLVGAGALHAGAQVRRVADQLGAGVAMALLGRGVLDDDLPFVTGGIGVLGTQPSWELMNACDTLLVVGSNFPYSEFLPPPGQARAVQIDIDARRLGVRYPTEVNLQGDSRETLEALLPLLQPKADPAWRAGIADNVQRWNEVLRDRALDEADPVNPQRVFHELSAKLPGDCMVACDTGSVTHWFANQVKLKQGARVAISGGLSTMGVALPYALAGKLAHSGRPMLALVGDGAMQMLGINALLTVQRLWREWEDPRFAVMVLNNGDLNLVTWEQRITLGEPKFEASQDLPCFDYAAYARLIGFEAIRVERPDDIAPAWDAVFHAKRPILLDVVVDPNVPPLPPHVEPKQARNFLKVLLRRDPQALEVLKAGAQAWWSSVFPSRRR